MQNDAQITVLIPTPLRRFTGGEAKVAVAGSSVAEVLDALDVAHPGIGERLRDDSGQLRRFVNVFVNGQNVRDGQGIDTLVSAGDEVGIIPAMAGGRGRLKAGASASATAEAFHLPEPMRAAIVDHAMRDAPRECCGIIAGRHGVPVQLYETRNVAAGNRLYEIDPAQLIDLEFRELPAQNAEIVAIYHSHPESPAYPSATDVELAFWPDAVFLICSLADRERPEIRGFRIRDGTINEVTLSP